MRQRTSQASAASGEPSIAGLDAAVEVRRHPRARRLTLRVSRTRRAVIVTLPEKCDIGEAGSFLHRHIDWVRERLGSIPDPVPFADGATIPLRGEPHAIRFTGIGRRVAPVALHGGRAGSVFGELHVAGDREHASRRLREWLQDEARRDLDASVGRHARRLGLRPKRIVVRDQTSRWGSCSTTGVLSFSWRLIMAPARILDYVAAHEVAHLAEMNHGPRFWALVARTMPDMDEAKRWLQVYGMDLHRYGVEG